MQSTFLRRSARLCKGLKTEAKQIIGRSLTVRHTTPTLKCISDGARPQFCIVNTQFQVRMFSSFPEHKVVPMPSLSPTMESGSIAKWNVKPGDKFDAGTSLCEVETDKATVSFDATDEGYVAKILVTSGEIKVGQPIMVTVEDEKDVGAFANFTVFGTAAAAPPKAQAPPTQATPQAAAAPVHTQAAPKAAAAPVAHSGDRVFISPLAKKMAKEAGLDLNAVHAALGGAGSGPNGRIVATDVQRASTMDLSKAAPQQVAAATPRAAAPSAPRAAPSAAPVDGVYSDFTLSDHARALAEQYTVAKQAVPHYYLSVELNLSNLLKLRENLNASLAAANDKSKKEADAASGLSVLDFIVKAAALSMSAVPDANASWMDTFVRRYGQVDVNLVMGAGNYVTTPVLRNVQSRGLHSISQEIASLEDSLVNGGNEQQTAAGTFSIHNLGVFGIKSAAPIVMNNQACALALGAIQDTVIPSAIAAGGWQVAPMMVATLSCDHRVIDGAVGAQWLSAFKQYVENPVTIML